MKVGEHLTSELDEGAAANHFQVDTAHLIIQREE